VIFCFPDIDKAFLSLDYGLPWTKNARQWPTRGDRGVERIVMGRLRVIGVFGALLGTFGGMLTASSAPV
jgi:hypothetical protein